MNKICTDIGQSRKLIELGIDISTADMRYGYIAPYDFSDRMYDGGYDEVPYPKDFLAKNPNFSANEYDGELPAWSLAALLRVLPYPELREQYNGNWTCKVSNAERTYLWEDDSPVDACVAMIIKLHEQKLL